MHFDAHAFQNWRLKWRGFRYFQSSLSPRSCADTHIEDAARDIFIAQGLPMPARGRCKKIGAARYFDAPRHCSARRRRRLLLMARRRQMPALAALRTLYILGKNAAASVAATLHCSSAGITGRRRHRSKLPIEPIFIVAAAGHAISREAAARRHVGSPRRLPFREPGAEAPTTIHSHGHRAPSPCSAPCLISRRHRAEDAGAARRLGGKRISRRLP